MSCFIFAPDNVAPLQRALATPQDAAWIDEAACGTIDDDSYFPEEGPPGPDAIARCCFCPVSVECLVAGLIWDRSDGQRIGWWGGLGPVERADVASLLAVTNEPLSPTQTLPSEPLRAARVLRDNGLTIPRIANELGRSERTIYRYLAAAAA